MLSVLTIITMEVHRYNPSVSFADSSPYTSGALAVYRIKPHTIQDKVDR